MGMDAVTRGCNCLELEQSGRSLLYVNGRHYAWFQLFDMKRSGSSLLQAYGHNCEVEQPCYMQMETVTCGSHSLGLKQSGRILLHANGHGYAWFLVFGVGTKWNKVVARYWTLSRMVATVCG